MLSRRSEPFASRWCRRLPPLCIGIALVLLLTVLGDGERAHAQTAAAGILAPGNAAVTGFSGAIPPARIPPGVDPRETTFIDLGGPSMRIVDLQNMGGAPTAQLVPAPKPFAVTAAQIGQVFAVALDNSAPPNIYVAASSAYGLPIVIPGPDRGLLHAKAGAANASFMPGLWGGAAPGGGPGSIWKIDGVTGAVSLFANVALDGAPNSGPALGGLVFDPESNSLIVADRETGMIHSFDADGVERGRYDHGVRGRAAQGLPPLAFDPHKRLDITSPHFDSEQPATWSYAPPERLIFGLGVFRGRLYYAVADGLQIWSVSILPDGTFGGDATIELSVPPAEGPTEIAKIAFDGRGRMVLAERPAPTGAYDFEALTPEGVGRVLRYALADSQPGAPRIWQPAPDEYAVGFPLKYRNANGGVALGYRYDEDGKLDRASCGGFLWSTGERLRRTDDATLAARLRASGPETVDGLQGNSTGLVRPDNEPPLDAYYLDYDDRFFDTAARGHLGDLAIWRVCGSTLRGGLMSPDWWEGRGGGGRSLWFPPRRPPVSCPPDQQQPGFQCCPAGASPDASGACKPWCPDGAMDQQSVEICIKGFNNSAFDPNTPATWQCLDGSKPDLAKGIEGCLQASPFFSGPVCPAGLAKKDVPNHGIVCTATPKQMACAPNEQISPIDGKCHELCPNGGIAYPAAQCCPPGSTPDPKTGKCDGGPPGFACPPKQLSKIDNTCCPPGQTPNDIVGGCCPPGQTPAPGTGVCQPVACAVPPNKWVNGKCCAPGDLKPGGACWNCGPGKVPVGPNDFCCDASKVYTDATGAKACCLSGQLVHGQCVSGTPVQPNCSPDSTDPKCCPAGYKPSGNTCCLESQLTATGICCPAGQAPSGAAKDKCQPLHFGWTPDWPGDWHRVGRLPPVHFGGCPGCFGLKVCCPSGLVPTADNSDCCPASQMTKAGTCCPPGTLPDPDTGLCPQVVKSLKQCAKGYTQMPDGSCCLNNLVSSDGAACQSPGPERPVTRLPPSRHRRVPSIVPRPAPRLPVRCGPGHHLEDGKCVRDRRKGGQGGPVIRVPRVVPKVTPRSPSKCRPGYHLERNKCVRDRPPGKHLVPLIRAPQKRFVPRSPSAGRLLGQ